MKSNRGIQSFWRAVPVVLGLAAAALAAPAHGQLAGGELYQKVKDVEGRVQLKPVVEHLVGTFDAATWEFVGLNSIDD
jgi:hypothetical protein